MRETTGRVPVRIDLAGGTIDIWPIHLTLPEPGVTVNAALALHARATVRPLPGGRVRLTSRDRGEEAEYASMGALRRTLQSGSCPAPLLTLAVEALVPEGGLSLETEAEAPAGSGLGGSSAVLACAAATLLRAAGREADLHRVQRLAQDVETRIVRGPTGYQDYFPPLFGGCLALEGKPGQVEVERLPVDLVSLTRRLRLVWTGAPHQSGITNWGALRAYFDGEAATVRALHEIADIAREVRSALRRGDLEKALRLVVVEGGVRRRMAPGISTPQIEALDAAVKAAGALGTKVMGAGGGGSVLVCLKDEREPLGLEEALKTGGARPLPCRLVAEGLRFEEGARVAGGPR